ncbi:MAG TPA: FGGY family carbohydrate kinase, partial [Clostridia bacterium]|nr:FGGY family carbohydrate kinase [Clostridia bacterium]
MDAQSGEMVDCVTRDNDTFMESEPWESIQNPEAIYKKAQEIIKELVEKNAPITSIGITGQMHGILYIDSHGNPLSPLYIWQDGRGDLPCGDSTYRKTLEDLTKCRLATGYGMVTHFYNLKNNLVPANTSTFCTIHDYVAMKLAGKTCPVMDPTDAASLGLYDIQRNCFNMMAVKAAGINPELLPEVSPKAGVIGNTPDGIPVSIAIGDNQASFLGSVPSIKSSILVNIGTGSQISLYTDKFIASTPCETRPFVDNGYLLVGA